MEELSVRQLACGATLLVERNHAARSVGMTWLLPMGSATDPDDAVGVSTIAAEWIWRGAGGLDSRAHSDALDRLGIQRSGDVETHHLRLGATLIVDRLYEALPLLTDLFLRPALGDDTFEPVRDLAIQAIDGMRDEPHHRIALNVRSRHFPAPFNRSGMGLREHLERLTPDRVRARWADRVRPVPSIVGVCGDVDADRLAARLDELLDGWEGEAAEPAPSAPPVRGYVHIEEPTAQVHISMAHDAPPEPHPHSVHQRIAVSVLSGGMSGRLFTEVRERRSLCYSVHASYAAGRDRGAIFAYSGTTPERAQETLDVLAAELDRIRLGVTPDEFQRAVVGLRSRLVMQGESTSARANAIAHDHFVVGRPRSLDELADRVESATLEGVNEFLSGLQVDQFTIGTIGPAALSVDATAGSPTAGAPA